MNESNAKKLKVLFFCKIPPPYTGLTIITKTNIDIVSEFADTKVINYSLGRVKELDWKGQLKYYLTYTPKLFSFINQYKKQVKRFRPDIVYFVGSSSFFGNVRDMITVRLSKQYSKKVVCHLHNGNYKDNYTSFRLLNAPKYLTQNVDTFIFSSDELSQQLAPYIESAKRIVLFNPVDDEVVFSDEEFLQKIKEREIKECFTITYLSNFIPAKGYLELLYAYENLRPEYKQKVKVRFIGSWVSENEKKFFLEYIKNLESDNIEYIGPIKDRKKIKEYLRDSDIFCLPTYYPVEAQPVSIIEAMNAGNAIISTFHASIPEYVENDKEGILVAKQNIGELANAIKNLCNRATWKTMAIAARQKFLTHFHKNIIQKQIKEIFKV